MPGIMQHRLPPPAHEKLGVLEFCALERTDISIEGGTSSCLK